MYKVIAIADKIFICARKIRAFRILLSLAKEVLLAFLESNKNFEEVSFWTISEFTLSPNFNL
jgi:hypothetical protein